MTEQRQGLLQNSCQDDEKQQEPSLRPRLLAEYVGQPVVQEQLAIFLQAARKRNETLDHCLIYGPPGLGKTTLAHIIAQEMGGTLHVTSGPAIERGGDLAALLTNLEPQALLFIDEIHRLHPAIEELLYPALEDRQISILIGDGPAARSIKLDLAPFTLIGATTRIGLMTAPLRDRFGIPLRLDFYNQQDLCHILMRSARLFGIPCNAEGAAEIAGRSRGTPRIANRLLRRVRDYADAKNHPLIDRVVADKALSMLQVDPHGLDATDHKLLRTLIEKFDGGPVGLETLSAAIGEDSGTIEDVVERYLIQQGLLERTIRGRKASPLSYRHLGLKPKGDPQQETLFDH